MPEKENDIPKKIFNLKEFFYNLYKKITEKTTPAPLTKDTAFDIIIALIPAAIFGAIIFNWYAALLLALSTATALLCEFLWNLFFKKPQAVGLLSATATGLVLGMCLPPRVPFWVAILISFIAIVLKQVFVLIKQTPVNYMALARVSLNIIFPVMMTKYILPLAVDTVTTATPMADAAVNLKVAFFGVHSGCIGETSAFLLLIGGLYLMIKRIINPIVPISFIATVLLTTLIAGQNPLLSTLGGGLMLAALFIATDYTTLPATILGKIIFGVSCGIITFIIRFFNLLPEGVGVAVIIVSLLSYCISLLIKYKAFEFIKAKTQKFFTKEFYKNLWGKILPILQKIKLFLNKYIQKNNGDNS